MIVILIWPLQYIKENLQAIRSGRYDIPRQCPVCGAEKKERTVVGHGRRSTSCHSRSSMSIKVRRGRCKSCKKTFTFLPCFVRPFHHYSVFTQAESLHNYLNPPKPGLRTAAISLQDQDKYPEDSTVRRWFASLGEEEVLEFVQRFLGKTITGEISPWSFRETKSSALKIFLKMWTCLQQALSSSRDFAIEALRLTQKSCFMFLLLLSYQSRAQTAPGQIAVSTGQAT